jgi:hypothetical protein
MAARSLQLALAGAAKRVSDAYGGPAGAIDAVSDIPYRQLLLQAETGAIQIGSANTVSATVYGNSIAVAGTLTLGPFETGPLKLSDLWAFGTGTLHILGIPY